MGLWDVLSGRQSLGSWLTGRDPAESDVYAHYELVDAVSTELRTIATTTVGNAQESIYSALNALNSVKGMEYVGTVTVGNYDSIFETVSSTITDIADQLEGKAEDIKTYEESPWYEKVGSTFVMTVCKAGEGLLSCVEDLGDGVLSVAGWVAGNVFGDKEGQEKIATAIKSEWSHDAFNFYYNSDFAKASAITEDSAIAGGFKLAGKAVGYLYAGGFLAGGASALGAASSFLGASSTTWAATAIAGLGGLGSGTESGLNAGMDYNSAFKVGLKEGGKSAALAFAGGKLGEKLAKNAAVKSAQKGLDQADDALNAAKGTKEALMKSGKTSGNDWVQSGKAMKAAQSSYDDAANALAKMKGAKLSDFQGYSDAVTKAGFRAGETTVNTAKAGVQYLGNTAKAAIGGSRFGHMDNIQLANTRNAASQNWDDFVTNGKQLLTQDNPIVQGARTIGRAGKTAGSTAWQAVRHPIQSAKQVLANVGDDLAHPLVTAKSMAGATANAVRSAAPTLPGIAAATINAGKEQPSLSFAGSFTQSDRNPDPNPEPIGGGTTLGGGIGNQPVYGPPPVRDPEYTGGTVVPGTEPNRTIPSGSNPSGPYGGGTDFTPVTPATPDPVTTPQISYSPQPSASPEPITTPPISYTPQPSASPEPITPAPSYKQPETQQPGQHSGGGYGQDGFTDAPSGLTASVADLLDDSQKSIDEIIKGTQYSRVPTTTKPILSSGSKGSSSVIPIAAGLSVASAAGLGAKAYMDYKKSGEEEEEDDEYAEDDEFAVDNWTEDEDTLAIDGEEAEGEFINQDKQDDDEYYRTTDNPFPIMGSEELEEF